MIRSRLVHSIIRNLSFRKSSCFDLIVECALVFVSAFFRLAVLFTCMKIRTFKNTSMATRTFRNTIAIVSNKS